MWLSCFPNLQISFLNSTLRADPSVLHALESLEVCLKLCRTLHEFPLLQRKIDRWSLYSFSLYSIRSTLTFLHCGALLPEIITTQRFFPLLPWSTAQRKISRLWKADDICPKSTFHHFSNMMLVGRSLMWRICHQGGNRNGFSIAGFASTERQPLCIWKGWQRLTHGWKIRAWISFSMQLATFILDEDPLGFGYLQCRVHEFTEYATPFEWHVKSGVNETFLLPGWWQPLRVSYLVWSHRTSRGIIIFYSFSHFFCWNCYLGSSNFQANPHWTRHSAISNPSDFAEDEEARPPDNPTTCAFLWASHDFARRRWTTLHWSFYIIYLQRRCFQNIGRPGHRTNGTAHFLLLHLLFLLITMYCIYV